MKRVLLAAAVVSIALGGCNWMKNLGKKDNVVPPTALTEFAPTVTVSRLWSASVGDGAGKSGVRLQPVVHGDRVYVASVDGNLQVLDVQTGRKLWSIHEKKVPFSGGPASNGDLVVVGTLDGRVKAYSAEDGGERWQASIDSEVISAPAVGADLVVVRSQDGRLYGFNPADGERRWVYEQPVPILSLRGNSVPLIDGGLVINGFDTGRVVAVQATDGTPAWSQALSVAEGRTEVERLADSDGAIALDGGILFAAAYRGQIAALDASSGSLIWNRDLSSYAGLAIGPSAVVVSDAEGNVLAFDRQNGANLWKQDGLLNRWLSGPAVVGGYVVVGDLEGYVHWLDIADGSFAAREKISKKPIEGAPVVAGNVVIVEDIAGNIGAFRIE